MKMIVIGLVALFGAALAAYQVVANQPNDDWSGICTYQVREQQGLTMVNCEPFTHSLTSATLQNFDPGRTGEIYCALTDGKLSCNVSPRNGPFNPETPDI